MKKIHLVLILLCGSLSSCYFVDDIFDPPTPKEPSLYEKAKKSIGNYLQDQKNYIYDPYGFGELVIKKPIDIVELEKLEKEYQSNPSAKLDSAITEKKRLIELYNIERTIELDHFFTYQDSTGVMTVYETRFTLNDTLGVKDVSAKIKLDLEHKYQSILDFFFYERPIFLTTSYQDSKILSQNFYAFFKAELERQGSIEEKSEFLLHTLEVTRQIKLKGKFDQQYVLERFSTDHMTDNRPDIEEYENLQFSDLYQTTLENSEDVESYYFFHKFIGSFKEQKDTNVVLIEFSPYYEINNIYQMDRPFAQYF
ncbi:MAG: hypothetical protein ABJG68_15560 [Crocinitomicaceae bacterium]